MSLYYEAAALLADRGPPGGSLKARIYKRTDLKSAPAQLVALLTEASRWSIVLKAVIEASGLLAEERKLEPVLALLLTHDLLLARNGVAAPANHPLKLAVHRHKARLTAEFSRARIKAGYATLDAFRAAVNDGHLDSEQPVSKAGRHPRWIRVNTLKTSLAAQMSTTLAGYTKSDDLSAVRAASAAAKVYYEDPHVPNLLAFPPNAALGKLSAYASGELIFQDKASCFPAYLLNAGPNDGDIVDACAAPGNKTTHLAAIISAQNVARQKPKVIAFERDKGRTVTLRKMVKLASSEQAVEIKGECDFLASEPNSDEFANVGALLLDPSCSGSGIVGRDDSLKLHLPAAQSSPASSKREAKHGKKRKRDSEMNDTLDPNSTPTLHLTVDDSTLEENPVEEKLTERLGSLSVFQLRIILHAMQFPQAHKITYSTCSVHFAENEAVVFQALESKVARERGWRILIREHQVKGLKRWSKRGKWTNNELANEANMDEEHKTRVLNACIRCEAGTAEGTMGFFVASFVRDEGHLDGNGNAAVKTSEIESEEEWNGFSDCEN